MQFPLGSHGLSSIYGMIRLLAANAFGGLLIICKGYVVKRLVSEDLGRSAKTQLVLRRGRL